MDINTARDVLSRRDELENRAQSILDRAARSNRNLLASESRDYDKILEELRAANYEAELVPDRLRIAVRERAIDESRDVLGVPRDFPHNNQSAAVREDLFEMIRANGRGHVDLNIGDMLAAKRTQSNGALERRDLFTTTTGAPVPTQTASTVYEYLVTGSGVLRSNVDILSTPNGDTYRLPKFTAYSTGTAVGQGSAIPESDPTLAMVEFGAFKYAAISEWSRELEFDANVNLSTYLGRNLGIAISEAYSPALVNGAGTAGPEGVLNAANGTVTGGTAVAGVPTVNNIIDLVYTLEAPYQERASFLMHPTTLSTISKIVDTTGRSILMPSFSADMPSTILGRPVFTDPNMPTTGTTNASIFFGDLSRYMTVRFAGPLRVEVSYDEKFSSDLVVARAVQRIDSRIVDNKAGAIFVGAAS
jgi:HK97 family phage major capsid protein